jgi:hypothetical protein
LCAYNDKECRQQYGSQTGEHNFFVFHFFSPMMNFYSKAKFFTLLRQNLGNLLVYFDGRFWKSVVMTKLTGVTAAKPARFSGQH